MALRTALTNQPCRYFKRQNVFNHTHHQALRWRGPGLTAGFIALSTHPGNSTGLTSMTTTPQFSSCLETTVVDKIYIKPLPKLSGGNKRTKAPSAEGDHI